MLLIPMVEKKPVRVGVTYESAPLRPQAQRLAAELGLPLLDEAGEDFPLLLRVSERGLELVPTGSRGPGPIFVDFASGILEFRRKFGGGRKQALARAVGLKKGLNPFVLDATAGLGRDGFILAALGCKVLLLERSPIIAALLADGLERARRHPELAGIIDTRLSLARENSILKLPELQSPLPEVIYLDPMYPHRTKSALVKKELRLLRTIAGEDEDAPELLNAALKKATRRVVVKRPRAAPPLAGPSPSLTIAGKKHRFDIYLVGSL